MSRALTPKDAHVLINAIGAEITGGNATIQAHDTSTFVSAGETLLSYGTENVMNAVAIVLGRRMIASRPYKGKFASIRAINSGVYSNRLSKISFYADGALADGSTNNQLTTNLKDGFDNNTNPTNLGVAQSTASMWEQHQKAAVEFFFAGTSTWQDCLTKYEDQIQSAFKDEATFNAFIGGIMTEKANDIETQKEAYDRMAVLNYIAGVYDMSADMDGSVINLTAGYNAEFGTTYTTTQLLTTYFDSFLAYFVSVVKIVSDDMTTRTRRFHWPVTNADGQVILRHTPKNKQKMLMLNEFWVKAESRVKPFVFNPEYLDFGNFESVQYWQNPNDKPAISITPAIPDTTDPDEQTAGDAVSLSYVLGAMFDEDALMTDYQLENAYTTPVEARKHYRNTWYTFRRNIINDFTENGVIFIMADPVPPTPDPGT